MDLTMGEANDEKHGLEGTAKSKFRRKRRNRSEIRARICGADTHILYNSSRRGPRIHPILMDKMVCFAQLAIGLYNINELTDFAQVKVLKVVVTYTGLRDYRITFQAFPPLGVAASLFVTKVRQYTSENPSIEIMSIKHKDLPCNIHEQTISQVTKTFSDDYLAPYLSQLALVMYNIFTIREEKVAVHDIPSLKVVKAMKHVAAEGTTYFVTFEASLHESKNIETFETQICVSTLFPPTTIEFNKVQIKHD